ncbi:MAG TPA: DUF2298 domain-containing protein [Anaerolineales bacterium]|nr:DUF2298 domain-containing protein [Anaerolineales bacterium]
MNEGPEMKRHRPWLYDLLFLLVLVVAAYLRLTGVAWGEGQHQHPDENHFTSVLEALRAQQCLDLSLPVEACPPEQVRWIGLGDYLSSETSTLSPYNRGFSFYVYGNLPMTIVRIAADATDATNLRLFGRQFSALADLFAIIFLYFLVSRLYGRRVGLLAALFSALTVMQIQQSHFFTVDLFVNTFAFLALWFAVAILDYKEPVTVQSEPAPVVEAAEEETPQAGPESSSAARTSFDFRTFIRNPLFLLSIGFGFALGMAMASKINIAPLAVVLPGAFLIRYLIQKRQTGQSLGFNRSTDTDYWTFAITCLVAGAIATLISFRIFQPYAFEGIGLNPQWVANIREQRVQATGGADVPWELQWARRTHLYSFTNLTLWGLGLPLGILAWAGFLYMGWRILKGEWRHALLWGWTAAYFTWQSLQFNPTMRYQLPIYPLLAMMAAWFVFEMAGWRIARTRPVPAETEAAVPRRSGLRTVLAALLGVTVLLLTAGWAFAFHSIYLRPEPRMAASRWIYQNIPGPINLRIDTNTNGTYNQPLPFPNGVYIQPASPYQTSFTAHSDGLLEEVFLAHVTALPEPSASQLYITVWQDVNAPQPLASTFTTPTQGESPSTLAQIASFDQAPVLLSNQIYFLKFELVSSEGEVDLCGDIRAMIQTVDQTVDQVVSTTAPCVVSVDNPYTVSFIPQADGSLAEIRLAHPATPLASAPTSTLTLTLSDVPNPAPEQVLATAALTEEFTGEDDPRGDAYTLTLDRPFSLKQDSQYYMQLEVDEGILQISSATIANETDYDYALPFRVDGYDAFSGLYRGDLTLQVYWDDTLDKLDRYVTLLNETDYILIPTNHQYAQITRLPERYPLTTFYYRELIGCPEEKEIIWCYDVAKPGMFEGRLGYDLVAVFESYPTLGPVVINDQSAEEAFTFYDHPKSFIFKKNEDFDIGRVQSILSSVDVSKAVRLSPRQFDEFSTLLLPDERLARQRAGGTWSDLFNYEWVQNRYPVLGLIFWYLFIFVLGLAVYPLARLAMPGLADKGYPLSRALGLVLFGYLAWLAGSYNIPYTRTTIAIIFGLLVILGAGLGHYQRADLREEWRTNRRYFLMVEGLFLAFFLLDLVIRLGNPDLWHPAKGGERPMDFSYFNAVIKSTVFPPFDPWFAGGYINYYYYGFVLVGTPVKLLGIVPSIAYNFILPTLFALVGVCAFSLGWNLLAHRSLAPVEDEGKSGWNLPLVGGLAASALTILLGNLGTIQLIYQKLQEMGAQGTFSWDSTISQRLSWAIQGLMMTFQGASLPIGHGDWYWNPSRVVPPRGGNEITEFPLFTFLYSDLHAHMIAIPLALLAIGWALAMALGRARWRNPFSTALGLLVGGLIIGVFYPTNLSDAYTYLLLGVMAVGYAVLRYAETPILVRRIALAVGAVAALYLLSHYLYEPYRAWYSQAYSALDPWQGPFTPVGSYLTHWLVFLFLVVSWMAWETREWMASTPASSLQKLRPFTLLIDVALVAFVLALLVLQYIGTSVGWIALPIAVWAAVLLLRPGLSDAKRFVLFLIGTATLITIVVEVVVVSGDIGRQNTIFKFYMQAWLLLAVSAGAAFAWTLPAFFRWLPGWRVFWQTAVVLLVGAAALFTLTGTMGKIRDRWIVEAPRTLDSIAFMESALYDDFGQRLVLNEDYRAIRWMQDNIEGSPVIVEGNCTEYRWCTRMTVYTGLPGVVGWNWHQRQQRVFTSRWVEERVAEVGNFYNSVDPQSARQFLDTYDVRYIVVGQLERAAYTPEGLEKFELFEGELWQEVYRDGNTAIYEVLQ